MSSLPIRERGCYAQGMESVRKGRSYFKLLDTLGEAGCPICSLVIQDGLGYLDSMMYERIMDVPTRMELIDSFGLCNWHTWQLSGLPHISSPDLGFAILASDLLRKFDNLAGAGTGTKKKTLKSVFAKRQRKIRPMIKQKSCPVCRYVTQFESYHLKEFLDHLQEKEFFENYETSQGICLLHFLLTEEQSFNHPNFGLLREVQAQKARSLRDTLERYIDKHDYRRRQKFTTAETKAGRTAMEFLSGKPGLFSSDIERVLGKNGKTLFRR